MQLKNIFDPIALASYVQSCKMYTFVTMLQDETKLCDSTVSFIELKIQISKQLFNLNLQNFSSGTGISLSRRSRGSVPGTGKYCSKRKNKSKTIPQIFKKESNEHFIKNVFVFNA
jgi:hypothetical protein